MHFAVAALLIAARMAHPSVAPHEPVQSPPAAVVVVDQAPQHFPDGTFEQEPSRRGPLVIFPPRRPLVLVPAPPRPTIIKVQKGNKGLAIGAIVGAGIGAAFGATAPLRGDIDREGATMLSTVVFGALGAGIGHVFDFQYLRPAGCCWR